MLRVEARGDEVAGVNPLSLSRDDSSGSTWSAGNGLHRDLHEFDVGADFTSGPGDGGDEGFSQPSRAADAHLRLAAGGQQRWDVVAEAGSARIDFAQAVEEQEAGLYRWVLEFAQYRTRVGSRRLFLVARRPSAVAAKRRLALWGW